MLPLCQSCGQNPAVVFVTQISDEQTSKLRLCDECAREKALGEGWFSQLVEQWSDEDSLPDEVRQALEAVPLEQILLELFDADFEAAPATSGEMSDPFDDNFEANFDSNFDADEDLAAAPFEVVASGGSSRRCPTCHTTWDKIRGDGRAGCAACYDVFRAELGEVMERVQRGAQHIGKVPRAAQKQLRRRENLRARREHQLELLQNRLKIAVESEKYEEAAQLRDKIRALTTDS